MGRGGSRFGAGRPGWRAKAEQSQALDVRQLHRCGVLKDGLSILWSWRDSHTSQPTASINVSVHSDRIILSYTAWGIPTWQSIRLEHTGCHFGGSRPWFMCPVRGERVGVLYMRAGRFACRHCQRIAYLSQSEDLVARAWRMEQKIEARLGPGLGRPKGMHVTTFKSLLSIIRKCEEARDSASYLALQRMGLM